MLRLLKHKYPHVNHLIAMFWIFAGSFASEAGDIRRCIYVVSARWNDEIQWTYESKQAAELHRKYTVASCLSVFFDFALVSFLYIFQHCTTTERQNLGSATLQIFWWLGDFATSILHLLDFKKGFVQQLLMIIIEPVVGNSTLLLETRNTYVAFPGKQWRSFYSIMIMGLTTRHVILR